MKLTPVDYDPFSGQMPGKNQDRVAPGPAYPGGPGGPQPDVSRNAPQLGAPILSSKSFNSEMPVGHARYTPVDYDPFEAAAGRTRRSVKPQGGRTEGAMTSLPEDILLPKSPLDYALYALGGPFRVPIKAAMLAAGGAMEPGDAEAGVLAAIRRGIKAYHGSPHDFDRFDLSKIGTGEGAQVYGHGLYFAEREGVAKEYKKALKDRFYDSSDGKIGGYDTHQAIIEAMRKGAPGLHPDQYNSIATEVLNGVMREKSAKKYVDTYDPHPGGFKSASEIARGWVADRALRPNKGHMYEVNINAKPEQFLDWDKPLVAQHEPTMNKLLQRVPDEIKRILNRGTTGQDLHAYLGGDVPKNEPVKLGTTRILKEGGIPGIKYLDQGSRNLARADLQPKWNDKTGVYDVVDTSGRVVQSFPQLGAANKFALQTPGTNNYVVFDDSLIDITKKYALPGVTGAGGIGSMVQSPSLEELAAP